MTNSNREPSCREATALAGVVTKKFGHTSRCSTFPGVVNSYIVGPNMLEKNLLIKLYVIK